MLRSYWLNRIRRGLSSVAALSVAAAGLAGCGPIVDDDFNDPVDGDCTTLTSDEVEGGTELDSGCYRAEDGFRITDGTLVLQPGTTIEFPEDDGIYVEDAGRLNAEGTEDDPILLTGVDETRGFWQGVRFNDSNSEDNVFEHVTVEYAGSSKWSGGDETKGGVLLQSESQLTVANSTFRENGQAGIVSTENSSIEISNSTFTSNKLPLGVTPENVGGIGGDNSFEGNDTSRIVIRSQAYWDGGGRKDVGTEASWKGHDIPYHVAGDVTVKAVVTVEPGAEFQFDQSAGVEVAEGGLNADGSGGDQIVFTGVEDLPGHWQGLRYNNLSDDNVLKNTVVEYGGSGTWRGSDSSGNVYLDGTDGAARLNITDTVIRGSGSYGISVHDDSELVGCQGVTFEENEGDPLYIEKEENASGCLSG